MWPGAHPPPQPGRELLDNFSQVLSHLDLAFGGTPARVLARSPAQTRPRHCPFRTVDSMRFVRAMYPMRFPAVHTLAMNFRLAHPNHNAPCLPVEDAVLALLS